MKRIIKEKNKPKITDWIQSISAAIAIPSAIIACIVFFQKDIQLQYQINKLDTIANQSLQHTKLLTNQIDLLKDELDFRKKQNNQSILNRVAEIKPKLIIDLNYYNGDIISARMINNVKSAKILKIKNNNPNDFVIHIPFQNIGEGKEKNITFRYKKPEERNDKMILSFTLFYEDIDRRKYSQDYNFTNIEENINIKNKNEIEIN